MKISLAVIPVAMALAMAPQAGEAKGCLKGALVGGAAGHLMKHHGVAGAAAGCAVGSYEANKKQKQVAASPSQAANNQAQASAETAVAPKKKHFWSRS